MATRVSDTRTPARTRGPASPKGARREAPPAGRRGPERGTVTRPRPAPPARPARPAPPRVRPQPPRVAPAPSRAPAGTPAAGGRRTAAQRMPFILLLVGLLCGALVCLLVISTTLAAGSFQITSLQQQDQALAKQQQQLQQQVAQDQAPNVIAQRAAKLGLRPVGQIQFLNVKNGKISSDAATGAAAAIQVPGYTP